MSRGGGGIREKEREEKQRILHRSGMMMKRTNVHSC